MVILFNIDGFSSIHGFAIVGRRMEVSASFMFSLLQVATIDQTLAFLFIDH